ncbi:adrenocorticotropic hormone receptor-like [Montipora foliosa]|uniref:adrenocorticotropic hormone receptor-like n=1 Tax=Montipora foliosa TaxID=591990 RepID=UPI0035F1F0B5
MNEANEMSHDHDHEHGAGIISTARVAIVAGIFSLTFSSATVLTNIVLLFTLFSDPYNYFRSRGTTYFVASLSLSDFLSGLFVQPLYSACMLCIGSGHEQPKLCDISLIFSHVTTKISIFTVVALALDRYLAVKLSWRYKNLVTIRKVIVCNIFVWLFSVVFEVSHSVVESENIFDLVDLHLQTTVPLVFLSCVYAAAYIEFRRYSRNVVFRQALTGGRSRKFVQNIRLAKKIVWTVVIINVVIFISFSPYLIAKNLENGCLKKKSSECSGVGFEALKALSVPMLCISSALNPFLYAWRIPKYRQAVIAVKNRACFSCQR